MSRPFAARFALVAALVLPFGCATVPGNAPPGAVPTAPLLTQFRLGGRLAADDGEHRFATAFAWSHTPSRAELSLFSPTGQTLALLTLEDGNATLATAEGKRQEADAATLLAPLLGFSPPPLSALTAWVQGDPGPSPDRIERDEAGRLYRVWHSGWIVTFDSWRDDRPRRLTIERGAARLVLLLDTWNPEP
ncbi:MAG: outer membrane lipoprotein LolB [Rhodocyclales bacterium]|nr:outer membrane lipoprotein LolB [Rhodocyclales bacterium]